MQSEAMKCMSAAACEGVPAAAGWGESEEPLGRVPGGGADPVLHTPASGSPVAPVEAPGACLGSRHAAPPGDGVPRCPSPGRSRAEAALHAVL